MKILTQVREIYNIYTTKFLKKMAEFPEKYGEILSRQKFKIIILRLAFISSTR